MGRRSRMCSVFRSHRKDESIDVRRESDLWRGGEPELRRSVQNPAGESGSRRPVGKSGQGEYGVCIQTRRAMPGHGARILVIRVVTLVASHVLGHGVSIRGHTHDGMGMPAGSLQNTAEVICVSLHRGAPCAELSACEDPTNNSLEEKSENSWRRNRAPHARSHRDGFREGISACTCRRDRPVLRERCPQRYHPGR